MAGAILTVAPATQAAPAPVSLTMLGFSDFHGRIDANTVAFAGTIEEQRADAVANGSTPFTVFAGDSIGASLFPSSLQQDQPAIDVLNAIGIDAAAVGNHEFDQGFDDLIDRVIDGGNNAQWPYLGANVYAKGTTTPALPEYALLPEANGVRIAVIGVVTEETPTLVSPAGVASLDFGDPVDAINRVADALTDGSGDEADVIVVAMHEGPGTSDPAVEVGAGGVFTRIVTQSSPKVDAILLGHTNQVIAWDAPVPGAPGTTRPIIQAGAYGANLGRVDLTYDPATDTVTDYSAAIVSRTTTPTGTLIDAYPSAKTVNDIVVEALASAAEIGDQPVATVTAPFSRSFLAGTWVDGAYTFPVPIPAGQDDRGAESTIGGLVAGALLDSLDEPERGGATIGVVNPGGLRAELDANNDSTITFAEANAVLPFVNNLWTTTLTGEQFIALLEEQWQLAADGTVPTRSYLQLGLSENVTYTFDADPDGDGVLVGDLDDTGKHITSVTVDGAPLDPAAEYRIATFSFLVQGGDNFRTFLAGTGARDSGLVDRDAWMDYLTASSPLTPEFTRQSVIAPALAPVTAGDAVAFQVGKLDMAAYGAPQTTSVTASLDGVELGTFEVVDGVADVSVTIPPSAKSGATALTLVAAPSGTTVTLPLAVTALPVVVEPTGPTTGPTTGSTPVNPTTPASTTPASSATTSGAVPTTAGKTRAPNLAATGASISDGALLGAVSLAVVLLGLGTLVLRRREATRS